MNFTFQLNFAIWIAMLPWIAALPPQQNGDFVEGYKTTHEPFEITENDVVLNGVKPPMTFEQMRKTLEDQMIWDFYLTNLEKFLEQSRIEHENYRNEAEVTAPEANTETIVETITETVEINEATQNVKCTTSDILSTTEGTASKVIESNNVTIGIEASLLKKSSLWKSLKSFVNNFDDEFNPLEPISKILNDINTGELWNNFTNYAAESLTCLNKFSAKSSKAMKKNIEELEEKVVESWKNFKHKFKLMP